MTKTNPAALNAERVKFLRYLSDKGLRLSAGRQLVFSLVMHTHGHFTAEELVKISVQKQLAVSRASVYRALNDLLEAGIIRSTAFGDKHHHFEHIYDEKPHHHAQCVRCHSFVEFPDKKEDKIYHEYLEKQGFKILGHEMHFYGICAPCRLKEK